eukprot:gene4421-6250_t
MLSTKDSAATNTTRRLVTVELIEARGIIACVKSGTSDPYAVVGLIDVAGRDIKNESNRSKLIQATLTPQWKETFNYGMSYDLNATDNLPSISVNLFHKAQFSVSDTRMGTAVISLDSIDPSGASSDLWVPLEVSGTMKTVSGEVHVKVKFSGPPANNSGVLDLEKALAADSEDLPEEFEDQPPNELIITVIQGRNLPIMDKNLLGSGGSSDPQVRIKIDKEVQKTKYIRKNLSPQWNETLTFKPMVDSSLSMVVICEDHNDVNTASHMGRIAIPLSDFDDKKPHTKWYKLKNKTMVEDGKDRGEVQLTVIWKFNPKVLEEIAAKEAKNNSKMSTRFMKGVTSLGQAVGAVEDSESDADFDPEAEAAAKAAEAESKRPESEEEKKKKAEEEAQKLKDLNDIDIKSGDYQVQVHIIEARDLKAENFDGTSDPIVYAEIMNQKQNTQMIKGVTSAVFDELMIFNFRNVDKEEFKEAIIRISCYDWGMTEHELYRKWVPLMDDEDPDDVGVQGYLKISIAIIGPGEKIKVHDEEAELAEEIKREAAAGGDVGSLILSVPTVRKEWNYIVATVFKCEGLPVMDGKVGGLGVTVARAKTDAFCKLTFAGGKPLKTRPVTAFGDTRQQINPVIGSEMWYPVAIPTMTQIIKLSVLDYDAAGCEIIGNVVERFSNIDKTDLKKLPIKWYNMYGAPEFKNASAVDNIKKLGNAIEKTAKSAISSDIDWKEFYNGVPDRASTFKGRVMIQWRIESKRPPKYEERAEIKPFKRRALKNGRCPKSLDPPTQPYILKALIACGTELPSFGNFTSSNLLVKVSIGINEISTRAAKWENGLCKWYELKSTDPIDLPIDLEQIPDIFIHLVREDGLKPVCFTRLKPYTNVREPNSFIGFEEPAKWFLMQEDKSINALDDGMFPGNVLIKLGFGPADLAKESQDVWQKCYEMSKKSTEFQMRVHVYQCKDIPPADSNGLADPYLKVNFMGKELRTKTVKKNLFPGYYETLVFDNVMIPEYEDFQYASQVCFRLYDADDLPKLGQLPTSTDEYLGTCQYPLYPNNCVKSEDTEVELPLPKWYYFFKEIPGDGGGAVLASVQLIPANGKTIPKSPLRSIIPPTRSAFIELIVIGVRDLAPYKFQEMQSPFMEIELNSFGSTYLATTATSKKPNPSNPNYLEKIKMPVKLPENSIFSSPLQIRMRDTRLGGFQKPMVGVTAIDLSTKIPWCTDTYIAPATDKFFTSPEEKTNAESALLPGMNDDPTAIKALELANMRKGEVNDDDFIASQEPINIDEFLKDRVAAEDTGAGVFGALNHIDIHGNSKKKKTAEDSFLTDLDWNEDDSEQPPKWSINRRKLEEELEVELQTTPFETYSFTRGKITGGIFGSTVKTVGKFKGLVRVIENENDPDFLPKELMDQLLKPNHYKVRLYCLRGLALAQMDTDIFGRAADSDPYLKVHLGKDKFNDRDNAVLDVKNADFYKLIEFDAELPGTSQLVIEVMDLDIVGKDDLIGKTIVDLEDRWFDSRWQQLGEENMQKPGDNPNDKTAVRWATKPVERRSLYAPNKQQSTGILECWVDIMKQEVAVAFPPDDVSLPPTQMFEVRVVIWKTKNVPPMDSLEGMSDLYVKCWPEGCKPQETDTHWRCKRGKASFNWRLLFDVELGHSTRAMKFPYLHLQLWDRDLLKWSDCAGEGVIDIGKFYRKAYKKNVAIKMFETKKGAAAKRAAKGEKKKIEVVDTKEDIPPPEEPKPKSAENKSEDVVNPLNAEVGQPTNGGLIPQRDEADSDDDDESHFDTGNGAIPTHMHSEVSDLKKQKADEENAKKKSGGGGWFGWGKKAEPEEEKKLLDEEGKANEEGFADEKPPEEKKKEDDEETKNMINTFKNMTGLWDIDPEDSAWYNIEQKDHNTGKITPMGSICYSVQIWPKDKALVMKSGAARSEPNTNPFCPPPVGRLKFSLNPFVMGSELCGPVLCAKLFCCILFLGFIALMIFYGVMIRQGHGTWGVSEDELMFIGHVITSSALLCYYG